MRRDERVSPYQGQEKEGVDSYLGLSAFSYGFYRLLCWYHTYWAPSVSVSVDNENCYGIIFINSPFLSGNSSIFPQKFFFHTYDL